MGFSYRHSSAPDDIVFTGATFQGRPGDPQAIEAEMERITRAREASQPIREKTGGSTFKNPPGMKAWELIDKAGCRGLQLGGAQVSTMHCNFLINPGAATAADLEALGEEVQAPGPRDERGCARMGDQAHRRRAWVRFRPRRQFAASGGIIGATAAPLYRTRRRLGERHTEQRANGQNGDHDPGFVDRLNQRGLFDKRLHHRQGWAFEWTNRAFHEHVKRYADKLGGVDIPGLQSLGEGCPERRRAGVDRRCRSWRALWRRQGCASD